MTEQEFMTQVWRPFDTVEVEGGLKARVLNVCFTTKSVRIPLGNGVADWFKCGQIINHTSATGDPDDLEMIANLHGRLMKAIEANEQKQAIIDKLQAKLESKVDDSELKKLRKAVNKSIDAVNTINARMKQIDEYLTKLNITEEE